MSIAAAVPIATSAVGALASNSAAKKSAKAVQDANAQSLALQKQMYDQTRSDLQPYNQGGVQALQALQGQLGLGGDGSQAAPNALKTGAYADPGAFSYGVGDYTASPAYQAQLSQGINAINSSMAARGALGSGATLKALQKYGSDLALQDFTNERNYAAGRYDADRTFNRNVYQDDRNYAANRFDTQNNNLFGLAQLGQSAASGTANAGSAYANSASQLFGSDAKAQTGAYQAQANAINGVMPSLDTYLQALFKEPATAPKTTNRPTTANLPNMGLA